MIKLVEFHFDELKGEDHWIKFARFGDLKSYKIHMYNYFVDFDFKLSPEEVYQVSFDQSTSNTGVFIKNYRNTEVYMIEVSKDKGDRDPISYMFNLERLLHYLFEGLKLSHMIYERPIITEEYRSSQVLFQLEGMILMLPKRYKEFEQAKIDNITASSWRSDILLEEFNKLDIKSQAENSIKTIYPWVNLYGFSIGKDKDIFEAMGVMFGWFMNAFDSLGRPYVRGDRYNGLVGGFLLPGVSAKEVSDKFKEAGLTSTWFMENPNNPIYDNIVSATRRYEVVCVEFTKVFSMLSLCVESNIKWMGQDKMTAVLVAANFVDKRLFDITGNTYHFVM